MARILVTGALGQIGSELVPALRKRYGVEGVVASDVRMPAPEAPAGDGPFEYLDCTHQRQIQEVVQRHRIDVIYHLAGLLSAVAEHRPQQAWHVNMGGVYRVLEVARQSGCALFFPSSIGAFGPTTPHDHTPQDTIQRPTTLYGISKVTSELLCDYYWKRFGVDTRGVRLPGVISHVAPPGGGTTDYAIDLLIQAVRYRHYTCFLAPDTCLDMMYIPDAIKAMIQLMEADPARLVHRNAFNVTAMSFTPARLAEAVRRHVPDFEIDYEVDPVRQAIAESWPNRLDDGAARSEWDWSPDWDLEAMTSDMIGNLRRKARGHRAA